MKKRSHRISTLQTAPVLALSLLAAYACGDDDKKGGGPTPMMDGGMDASSGGDGGGGSGSGGRAPGTGGQTPGSGGMGGMGGMTGMDAMADMDAAVDGMVSDAIAPDAMPDGMAPDATPDAAPTDGEAPGEGGEAGPPACSAPANATDAKVCLAFNPDVVTPGASPDIDGMGTLVISVFGSADITQDPLVEIVYPPPGDAGLVDISVSDLPTIPIDGLPETVYIRSFFIDNPMWFQTGGFTWGMWVGGYDLNAGVQPPPTLRQVDLTDGEGTLVTQRMTVLRKYATNIVLNPAFITDGGLSPAILDDAQGPLSAGVFQQAALGGAPVFGGAQLPCVDAAAGPIPVTGFFYALQIPAGGTDFYFGAQVDDFNLQVARPEGALISVDGSQNIPANQVLNVTPNQYSVQAPTVVLTGVSPLDGVNDPPAPFACP